MDGAKRLASLLLLLGLNLQFWSAVTDAAYLLCGDAPKMAAFLSPSL